MAQTSNKTALSQTLLNYYDGDRDKVKQLADDCKFLGFPIGDNVEKIMEQNEVFQTLIILSDFGTIRKLKEVLEVLKGK